MTALPIAGRELRVAARKRSTFVVRLAAALVALIIGGGFLAMASQGSFGIGPGSLGRTLFAVLTWLCLGAVLSAGLFLTSDCLSEEKRDGTLGLLFLTDLKGYDIVSGKLLSSSLRGLYALLAAFPVLAITLLIGGVSGLQFWKTCIALLNALFVSLAVGLFISTISRDSQKALAGTLFVLVVLVAAGPIADGIVSASKSTPFNPSVSISSPGYCFAAATAWGRSPFWWALLVNQMTAWTLFCGSCLLVSRTWQERVKSLGVARNRIDALRFGSQDGRATRRERLLNINPVLWLASRERWQAILVWALTLCLMAGGVWTFVDGEMGWWFAFSYLGGACTLFLYIAIASQAGRLFVQARRNGLFELMLVTPLGVQQIIQGQWRALLRMFGVPLLLWLTAIGIGSFFQQRGWTRVTAAATTAATGTNASGAMGTNSSTVTNTVIVTGTATRTVVSSGATVEDQWGPFVISILKPLTVAGNFVALIWFGMWMGLNSRNTNLSTLKTLLFVQIIPWLIVNFVSGFLVMLVLLPWLGAGSTRFTSWWPLLMPAVTCVLCLLKDVGFIAWSRPKLYAQFRERASGIVTLRPVMLPPPVPPSPSVPAAADTAP